MLRFEAVLFDCDGVLVDSEPITNGVLRQMLNEAGWALTPAECEHHFIGRAVRDQRALVALGPLVMEGRDIGSVVFPESRLKFYIDASEEVRAARRRAQGHADQVAERDRLDSTRKSSPLVVPEGAQVIDNSHLTLEQAVEAVLAGVAERLA